MVRLGHAVPSQVNGNGSGDRDDPGTLQRMLVRTPGRGEGPSIRDDDFKYRTDFLTVILLG